MQFALFLPKKFFGMKLNSLKDNLLNIIHHKDLSVDHRLQEVCSVLKESVPHYDWVGFYFQNGTKNELKLRAFAGEPTEHQIIPFGKGICGQVAESGENFMVPDVEAQDNFLACNMFTKAELVVPLYLGEKYIGQIDIDSATKDPFTEEDEEFLKFINGEVAKVLSA